MADAQPNAVEPSAVPDGFICIGRTVGVFGLKGECKVEVFSNDPERLLDLTHLWLLNAETGALKKRRIVSAKVHKGRVLVRFEGITRPEQVEPLLRQDLYIPLDARQPLAEGEYYLSDLIGLTVLLPDGATLGTLLEVIETGANDVYVVELPTGKRVLLPATAEVIGAVDLAARTMTITPLPGLLEATA